MSTGLFYFAGENFGECEQSFLTVIGFVVHSLRRQRTNQESDLGAQPLRTWIAVACYTQKTLAHFLLNARGSCIAKTLLSPPQKGRRKHRGVLREERTNSAGRRKRRNFYGKNIKPVGTGRIRLRMIWTCPFQCETNQYANHLG